jgi:periplasmic protein TonB
VRSSDYPFEALLRGNNGIVHFRLDVAENGDVSGCQIQAASRPADFATATCKALTSRAKFSPAINQQGQAIRSYYVNTVRWIVGPY